MIFCISVVSVVNFPLSFLILFSWVLFFLMSMIKGFFRFVYLFKETAPSFINLFYCFFSLYVIYFHYDHETVLVVFHNIYHFKFLNYIWFEYRMSRSRKANSSLLRISGDIIKFLSFAI